MRAAAEGAAEHPPGAREGDQRQEDFHLHRPGPLPQVSGRRRLQVAIIHWIAEREPASPPPTISADTGLLPSAWSRLEPGVDNV